MRPEKKERDLIVIGGCSFLFFSIAPLFFWFGGSDRESQAVYFSRLFRTLISILLVLFTGGLSLPRHLIL